MKPLMLAWLFLIAACLNAAPPAGSASTSSDLRNIRTGAQIPDEGYCDQPYVVVTDDGNWLCVLTTGPGIEGDPAQHIVATISSDQGKTWSPLIDIEPRGPPEASWAMPAKVPGGRVYVFYNYNGDCVRQLNGKPIRTDMLGHYVYKYSDDHGKTWSKERYRLPVRVTAADRSNDFKGKVQIFWGVGKPAIINDSVYFGFAKIGKYLQKDTEGFFFRSRNILTEKDPARIAWEMLPEGDVGIKGPRGPIAEEHNLVGLSDGGLYCTFRTTDGHLGAASSHDGGRTWKDKQYAAYARGNRFLKNPRSPAFVRKFKNGKYVLLFHNHGGKDYYGRNPYWLSAGVEQEGTLRWSEPEICLYDDDPATRIGYPDFIESNGRYFVTETQKTVARVHELDGTMLHDLWRQAELKTVPQNGLVVSADAKAPQEFPAPRLPNLVERGGFTIDFKLKLADLAAGQVVLDTRDPQGKGVALTTTAQGTIHLELSDGKTTDGWDCDAGLLKPNQWQHVAVTVDGGPRIITFIVDGMLNDGGESRRQGWYRFKKELGDVNGAARLRVRPSLHGELQSLRAYNRPLRTSEVIGNYRAGL